MQKFATPPQPFARVCRPQQIALELKRFQNSNGAKEPAESVSKLTLENTSAKIEN
jgi:hypothetical protein